MYDLFLVFNTSKIIATKIKEFRFIISNDAKTEFYTTLMYFYMNSLSMKSNVHTAFLFRPYLSLSLSPTLIW